MFKFRSVLTSTAILVVSQALGLLIPLLTLPFVARALGVAEFGKVMLAQAIVFFGVVFIDAGFNTESQRRVALAQSTAQSLQILYDNIFARTVCSIPVVIALVGLSFLFNDLTPPYVLIALLHIVATLAFPQWWLIGSNLAVWMGLASTVGRLLAAALTLIFVRTPDDSLWAIAASSSGALWAGLLITPLIYQRWKTLAEPLDKNGWQTYLRAVRPTILSGFFASASNSTPAVLLGWISGVAHVGLFTAADRLTRAAAHLLGVIEQSLMGQLAKVMDRSAGDGQALRKKLMLGLTLLTASGCTVVGAFANFFVSTIFGDQFLGATSVLQILCIWLWLHAIRRAGLLFTLSLEGNLQGVSRFQWYETGTVTLFATLGAFLAAEVGVAMGLVGSEMVLALLLWRAVYQERSPL